MSSLSTVCKVAPVRTPPVALLKVTGGGAKKIAAVFDGYGSDANLLFAALNDFGLRYQVWLVNSPLWRD